MPQDARPLSSLRLGAYDEPPASSESSTPQTRRSRLRRAIQDTRDLARDPTSPRITLPMPPAGARRSLSVAPATTRRRQRSASAPEDEPASASNQDEGRRRRYKRRRLDPSPPSQPKQAIKYGYYGQVEPGRLKLDLISCDGGEHRDPRHPGTSLGPENLLGHDKSVYCSERPFANVVLRHLDEGTPFCLEKLWIVGPEHGFTAPVREGLVYVAMTLNDLRKYIDPPPHARLSRFNTSSPRHNRSRERLPRSLRSSPERLALVEALRDHPDVNAAPNDRERGHPTGEDYRPRYNPYALRRASAEPGLLDFSSSAIENDEPENENESYYARDFGFGRTDPEAHCDIPSSHHDLAANLTSSFLSADNNGIIDGSSIRRRPVTTLLTDEEPGPEDSSTQDVLDYRLQRLRLARRRFEADHWDREERWAGLNRLPPDTDPARREGENGAGENDGGGGGGVWGLRRLDALMARSRVNDSGEGSASPERERERERERDAGTVSPPPPPARRWWNGAFYPSITHTIDASEARGRGAGERGEDTHITRARFYIKRHRNKVAIKFDPPVSGRFVLLKLWADVGRGNVDVQSVIAVGFGGGRFFPSVGVR